MVPVAILLALAGVVLSGIVSGVRDGGDDRAGDSGSRTAAGVEPSDGLEVLSVDGYGDLLDAIEEETGSTEVFDAVLYPTYAVGSLPLDSSTQRDASFTWDGALETLDETTTSPYTRIDLGDGRPRGDPAARRARPRPGGEPDRVARHRARPRRQGPRGDRGVREQRGGRGRLRRRDPHRPGHRGPPVTTVPARC